MVQVPINITIDSKGLELIDAAAKKERRSRSKYLEYYGVKQAEAMGITEVNFNEEES